MTRERGRGAFQPLEELARHLDLGGLYVAISLRFALGAQHGRPLIRLRREGLEDSFSPSDFRMAARLSPSAVRMAARRVRSACICFSIACWMSLGGMISFSSTSSP